MRKTDELGSADFRQYKKNIELLKPYQNKFDTYQTCYYKYLMAYIPAIDGDFDSAKSQLSNLTKECKNSNQNLIRIRTILSNIQVISSEYETSITNLDYALAHIDDVKYENLKLQVYATAALVYRLLSQFDLSLKFSQLLLNQNPSIKYQCNALSNQNRIKIQKQDKTLTNKDISYSIEICEQAQSTIYANLIRLDWYKYKLNNQHTNKQDIHKILKQLQHAEKQIDATQYANLISIKNSIYAQIYHALGDTDKMLKYAQLALSENESLGNTKQKIDLLDLMINHYKHKGDFEIAFKFLAQKNKSQQFYLKDKQAKFMAYQTVKHNNLAKTQEIDYLNKKNELLSYEKTLTEKTTNYQWLFILSLIIIVFLIFMWAMRSKKEQKVYKRLSERDHMTLIFNRKGLKEYMDNLLPFAEKKQEVIAYAIFDLDYFKNINDTYGHVSGDWVIKKVIKECQTINNNKVTFGRIGGEEFAIVMHHSTKQELTEFSELCRLKIAEIDTTPCGYDFNITASFGVTSTSQSGYVYSQLMTHADQAMYDAKIAGRNMVVQYQKAA